MFDPSVFDGGLRDAFVTKVNATGSALVYSTYLGGSGREQGRGIAVDADGNAYVTGFTDSPNFPGTAGSPIQAAFGGGLRDAFVTKVNAAGSALDYSTYLGGSSRDVTRGIAVDADGNAYVTGETDSPNFPGTAGSLIQAAFGGGQDDAFVAKIGVTAKELKEDAIAELNAVKASILSGAPGVGDIEDAVENLDDAIAFVIASLNSFDPADPNRLIVALGEGFFDNEEDAVEEIFDAVDSGEITNTSIVSELETIIFKLLDADELIVDRAISDAVGGDPDDLADAEAERDTALAQKAACFLPPFPEIEEPGPGPCDDAVGSFEDAWENAQRAVGALP